jgi:WD40 repeat protein
MQIPQKVPVIGPFLYRRSVRVIAGVAKNGDPQAVRELIPIARTCSDVSARKIALDALTFLPSQEAIDVFCSEVLAREDLALEKIAASRGYLPSDPGSRALFVCITGQEEALCRFDPDAHRPLLAKGYADAPAAIKNRALRSDTDTHRDRHLAHALMGTAPVCAAGTWSYDEWKVIISAMTEERAWDMLWLLVGSAPPSHAVAVLNAMKMAGWKPAGDDRPVFEELVAHLPGTWAHPAPEKPLCTMGIRDSQCQVLAFSRDGSLLAEGNCDGKIAVWQTSSARLVASFTPHAGPIRFLVFVQDNAYLVSGTGNGSLTCFGIPSGNTVWSYADNEHPVSSVVQSGNGEELIAGDEHGGVIRIGCRTGKLLPAIQEHPSRVTAIAPAPDGRKIVCGHADGTLCCRDPQGSEVWTVPGTGDAVRALAYAGEGDQLFVVSEHSLPALRDACTGAIVRTYIGFSGYPACHALLAENHRAAIGSDDRILRFWDWQEKYPTAEISFYNRLPTCCALTPDGTLAAAGCNEGTVYYYRVSDGQRIKEFRGYRQSVTACTISPNGTMLATTGGDGTVTLHSIPSGELLRTLRSPAGAVTALALTSGTGGVGIVAGTADGSARIFSFNDGTLVRSIDMYTPSITALAVSPDGKFLAAAGKDRSLRIWDPVTGGLVATCEGLTTSVRCLAFLQDSAGFISGGWDGVVRIWDMPGGKLSGTLSGHSSIITCCCVDPKGRFVVTGSNDTSLRIWQRTYEKKCIVIRDAKYEVSACAISPDGTLLAAAGTDPVIRLYNLPEGTPAGTIAQVPGKPTALAFTGDGLAFAVGYDAGILAFYAVHGHALIRTLPALTGAVTGIVAIGGEDCIVTSGTDGMIHTFRVPCIKPLSHTTLADLAFAQGQEQAAGTEAMAEQWRFLCHLLSLRFQNEIELCPTFRDAGLYDIQIVG